MGFSGGSSSVYDAGTLGYIMPPSQRTSLRVPLEEVPVNMADARSPVRHSQGGNEIQPQALVSESAIRKPGQWMFTTFPHDRYQRPSRSIAVLNDRVNEYPRQSDARGSKEQA